MAHPAPSVARARVSCGGQGTLSNQLEPPPSSSPAPRYLTLMANLAVTYGNQGQWEVAGKLFVQVIISNLALTYAKQGR